ncbi:sugar ABC transporter permease [Niallia circulans]|uniref:Sugar ABC transporter permease n=2 Tax=Bacillaceae TaxID=186817 RepID=A0A268F997_NIACI|nr:sugar ABC transporter permease [Niallia circulans]AYV74720.1 sugar ABC transporter permease [Niallia circulans]NRG29761.1 sugar ABC transporter permease [Niallia circulans]PAD81909.1 sugar ABC transporter permease [Niallia circulans]QJX64742.1 sugar ABC transporter permease [Niallia circulans]
MDSLRKGDFMEDNHVTATETSMYMEAAKKKKKRRTTQWTWYIFLIPSFLGILLFMVYPVIESFRLSFFKSNGTIESFTGLDNFRTVLTSGPFWNAVWNTFFIGIFQVLITIPLGFIFATLINSVGKGKNFFKVIYFLPNVTSIVAAAMIFQFVLHPEMGIVNFALDSMGLPTPGWFSEPSTSKWGVILLAVWHWIGFVIIICLANLQAIPSEMYEAAKIDGASGVQQWLFITIPNMTGTFAFLLITGWIGALQRFNEVYVIGGPNGSPARSIQTMGAFIYERGFTGFEFGIASAATYIMFIIILIFTFINLKISKMKI